MQDFKYDVALSFLAKDENIATCLADILSDRLNVFLYSRCQEQLGGTDGEQTFNDIFSVQARVVVVLYRDGWGKSPWTRIEEIAIRNRGFEFGYDFVLFAPVEDRPSVPQWLPKNRIWIGIDRFGLDGAASVIDARVQDLGGKPKTETLQERAKIIAEAKALKAFRSTFFGTPECITSADQAYDQVLKDVSAKVLSLQAAAPNLNIKFIKDNRIAAVIGEGLSLCLDWHHYTNTLEGAYIHASLWKGPPPLPGFLTRKDARPIAERRIEPDLDRLRALAWMVQDNMGKRLLGTDQLCEFVLEWWLNRVCLLYTSPSPRDGLLSRMPSSA